MRKLTTTCVMLLMAAGAATAIAAVSPAQKVVQDHYATQARTADAAFKDGSVQRGEAFFQGRHTGGKADSPSCTSCHTSDLKKPGKTRAGKEIAPMAPSVNPKRLTDLAEVEKWFKRNCSDVLGRECTAPEKADVIAYLLSL